MKKTTISFIIVCSFLILFILALAGCENKSNRSTENQPTETKKEAVEPTIIETDWADYFDGINGAAVTYEPTKNSYQIYNQKLALTQRSPCSTFKIILVTVIFLTGMES